MSNLVDIPSVVRKLVDSFSEYNEAGGSKQLEGVTVKDGLVLSQLNEELLAQPEVKGIAKRFRMNPFDMENVFDLEDVLKKALEKHPVFSGHVPETTDMESVIEQEVTVPLAHPISPAPGADGSVPISLGIQSESRVANPQKVGTDDQGLLSFMSYMQWANNTFYQSCAELPAGTLTENRPMLFDNMLNLLNHVYVIALVWKAHLEGVAHKVTSRRSVIEISFAELRRQQSELDDWYVTYAAGLSAEQLQEIVNFEFIEGGEGTMSRYDILHHVVNHASYHRGHIEGVFYQIGVEPPTTDLPVFIRDFRVQR